MPNCSDVSKTKIFYFIFFYTNGIRRSQRFKFSLLYSLEILQDINLLNSLKSILQRNSTLIHFHGIFDTVLLHPINLAIQNYTTCHNENKIPGNCLLIKICLENMLRMVALGKCIFDIEYHSQVITGMVLLVLLDHTRSDLTELPIVLLCWKYRILLLYDGK